MHSTASRREFLQTASVVAASARILKAAASTTVIAETSFGKVRGVEFGGIRIFKRHPVWREHRRPKPLHAADGSGEVGRRAGCARIGTQRTATGAGSSTHDFASGHRCVRSAGGGRRLPRTQYRTPGPNDGRKRPVMFWCHGGGFATGSGSSPVTDGSNLARRGDAVVVTINHRLNVLGFTYLQEFGGGEFAPSGDAGMLDIVHALKWVRNNIAQFGGDPNRVWCSASPAEDAR